MPSPGPAGHPRAPWPHGRPALLRSPDPAHRSRSAHREADRPPARSVRDRRARRGRGDLGIYQRMIAAYREPDPKKGRELMSKLIASISHGVPAALTEVITLGRTLKKRAADILAYFDRPGTSNGPTEAINGRLEHLRGSAPGFRNLTNYIARCLLEAGGFRPRLHPRS